MYTKSMLAKKRVSFYRLLVDLEQPDAVISPVSQYDVPESRATRLVGDSNRFMTVSFSKKSQDRYIRPWLEDLTLPGKSIEYDDVKYTFLGFTENHLKAGHLLFFREGVDFTVDELKEEFGDLKAVYNTSGYGKYAARLGLSFSSTVAAEEIELKDRKLLDDLRAEDGSLTSDGCGLIRDSYAQEVSRVLGIPPDTAVYQIRLGGIKGVLTRCPDDVFDTLCGCRGKKIAYRSSMVKYNNGSRILEVQNVSKAPKCGRLNKQFIVLLLTLGIPLSVFEDLLQVQLEQIAQMVTNREKALACVDGDVDAEGNGFHQELYEMLLAGHDMNEPYLACLLHRFQKASLDALREKLNIPVTGSGNVYGVVDHCDVLAEGEVYINLPGKGGPQVGPVAMMRNPAYDPNGTRVLEAVNRPALSHLTNCIVFSAKGAHSETDRMGGGDLDGDLYFFVFDPALIPKPDHLRLAPPPTSTTKKPALRKKTLKIAGRTPASSRRTAQCDMRTAAIDTFLSMRCNFHLGALANEWMARVGSTPALADSPDCKTLLPMIEAALDMVKSGENIALLKYEFNAFKSARPQTTAASGWKDPLVQLARLVPPAPRAELTDFTCDPQLVLQAETPDVYAEMVRDAKVVMRAYNTSLCIAIEADRAAKEQGWQEDEKRADLVKAAIVAQHFPAVENVLLDVPKYMLKASVWYFTGYENKKQAFAWLGSRWLNYIKACAWLLGSSLRQYLIAPQCKAATFPSASVCGPQPSPVHRRRSPACRRACEVVCALRPCEARRNTIRSARQSSSPPRAAPRLRRCQTLSQTRT
ncbi:RNA dependent RNA polymerase-domain-containing protein [Mycena sp. CBHHK59/15]|nr:RNA dependent RNA polymerase-domain-containing protein [Mycena sp. CBHHK59/15]